MFTRSEAVKNLEDAVKICQKEGVAELLQQKNIVKLREIEKQLDFSKCMEFLDKNSLLGLQIYEIPKNLCLEYAFCINCIGNKEDYYDFEFFDKWRDFKKILEENGGNIGKRITKNTRHLDLSRITLEEMLA